MYTILGCGAAGTLVCFELLQKGVDPSSIRIIDPFFDGGALLRSWGAIYSNTTCQQIVDTLQEYTILQGLVKNLAEKYNPANRILLSASSPLNGQFGANAQPDPNSFQIQYSHQAGL